MTELGFYLIASVTIASAFWVVASTRIIHSAVALLFTLFGVAGLYVFLYADFLAAAQVIIYVGGILVLIIFGVMLTAKISNPDISHSSRGQLLGSFFCLVLMGLIITVSMRTEWPIGENTKVNETVYQLGEMILFQYLLPFEIVSLLLLGALIGAALLSRRG